ncbi:MAG: DUF4388 domain-containing protein [candidate division Zixibacteria bacterium]|nr:DUF4388 domain-containing protein [candidate division Zixibacteria bacterium]
MDLDLQGNIEKFTLPEIFHLVAIGRKSGTLGIQRDDFIVMVYFDKGDIIYGYGPRQTYHLGQLLKEKGKLTVAQLEEAVASQARTDNSKRLGEILINKGFIDRSDLEKVVSQQVEELLYSLLSWQSGSFKFYENQFPTEEEITVKLSVENVILEGLRRLDEMNFIKETLPNFEVVFSLSATQAGRARAITLEADEWNVMALVDGYRSIDDICAANKQPREKTLRVLSQLKLAGIVISTEKKNVKGRGIKSDSTTSAALETMVNRLALHFEDYLTEKSASSNRMSTRTVTTPLHGEEL